MLILYFNCCIQQIFQFIVADNYPDFKMKRLAEFCISIIIFLTLIFIPGCKIVRLPTLSTEAVSNIGPTSAVSGGNITSDGNAVIIFRGVCYGTERLPDIEGTKTQDTFSGEGTGVFSSEITQLTPSTLYYVRAYATNSEGTAYGNQLTFTTIEYSIPEITTSAVTGITQTTAVSGGTITNNGGLEIIVKGVCWSTGPNPTISDQKTSDGGGTGAFISNITGLTGNTTYYIRAYATNSEGTGYGQELSFKTSSLMPVITTLTPAATSTTTGSGGGNVINDGGSVVTAKGVCWGTNPNPTIAGNNTNDGTGTGSFTSTITGLTAYTTYHVRAYATNSVGTAYGSDKTFTTDPLTVDDNDGNSYDVIRIGTQVWMAENLKTTILNDDTPIPLVTGGSAWSSLTSNGYCWYNNTISNKDTYGALYNWYTVSSGVLCPEDWHVPTDNDWLTLESFLGGSSPAGGILKETGTSHWTSPNTGATDEYDFTALPGGIRTATGTFQLLNTHGYWWTSTENTSPPGIWYRHIQYDNDKVFRNLEDENAGMSVRCIMD